MTKHTACETLEFIIKTLLAYLEELSISDDGSDEFICGERTAYVECLEIVQGWKDAAKIGLDFDIENRFPLVSSD